jgi:flagellar protein FlgJ
MDLALASPASNSAAAFVAYAGSRSQVPVPRETGPKDPKAWKQAVDFEQMFLEQTLGQLTSGLSGPGPLGDEGTGADVWRSMLTQQYAKSITQAGGVGIAPTIYSELMRLQEASHDQKQSARPGADG